LHLLHVTIKLLIAMYNFTDNSLVGLTR